tara:strand:- start:115 stop:309 length:195 start_codon:yes stop_codon:yes gene_type:complete
MAGPSIGDIERTVQRLEQRYAHTPHFAAYRMLCQRFETDLDDRRDLALAKSAALMLIKQLEGDT